MTPKNSILNAECLAALRALPDNSADSFVTDPPYGLTSKRPGGRSEATKGAVMKGFMGMTWDHDVPPVEVWAECLRVLKPGGYLLSFGGTRTYHRLATRIEDAGFILHPMLGWIFGSDFPKATRIDLPDMDGWRYGLQSLKPAMEPIAMAQKPFSEKTGAANIARWGTGAINIDACRIQTDDQLRAGAGAIPARHNDGLPRGRDGEASAQRRYSENGATNFSATPGPRGGSELGRWPANVIHDGSDEVLSVFPEAAGQQGDLNPTGRTRPSLGRFGDMAEPHAHAARNDSGSAARFFYCAKPSKKERNLGGCDNTHPTVKPVALMRYLCRLVTPARGLIIDPYAGSGTTGIAAMLEGFDFQGFDLVDGNCQIARTRIAASGSL